MLWDDAVARARGLATHLLGAEAYGSLVQADDVLDLVRQISGIPAYRRVGDVDLADVERHVGLVAAERLKLLGRWLGPTRRQALAMVYQRIEFDNIRMLARGIAQGVSPAVRLRSTTPTPDQPRRTLEVLSQCDSVADLAGRLRRLGHPAGRVMKQALEGGAPTGLFFLECALARLAAVRRSRAAGKGGRQLREHVEEMTDLENSASLMVRDEWGPDTDPAVIFLPGGNRIDETTFGILAAIVDPDSRRRQLIRYVRGSALETALEHEAADRASVEVAVEAAQVDRLRVRALQAPLGPAILLRTSLRIRAEAANLRAIVWGVRLGAPAPSIERRLLVAA